MQKQQQMQQLLQLQQTQMQEMQMQRQMQMQQMQQMMQQMQQMQMQQMQQPLVDAPPLLLVDASVRLTKLALQERNELVDGVDLGCMRRAVS